MKVLVTGATGFIGRALAQAAQALGWEVHVLVRPESRLRLPAGSGYNLHWGSLPDLPPDMLWALSGMDVVFHAAAIRNRWGTTSHAYQEVNITGTQRLAEAARKRGVGRFVYLSSVGVYGFPGVLNIDENMPVQGNRAANNYHGAKVQAEIIVRSLLSSSPTQAVIVRPTITYGPGDQDGMVTRLIAMMASGRFLRVGPGDNLLHLTYIDDLVSGILLSGIHPAAASETFNLSGPHPISFRGLVERVQQALEKEATLRRAWLNKIWLPEPAARLAATLAETSFRTAVQLGVLAPDQAPPITHSQVDIVCRQRSFSSEKAAQLLGYQPKVDEAQGLVNTIHWMLEQGKLFPAAAPSPASSSEKAY